MPMALSNLATTSRSEEERRLNSEQPLKSVNLPPYYNAVMYRFSVYICVHPNYANRADCISMDISAISP